MALADIRVGLRAYLLDDAGIAAIVSGRVFPVRLPQGETRASIVYTRISGLGDWHMQGPSGLSRPRVQIDCWSQSADTAATLSNIVKERLDGASGTWLWGDDSPAEGIVVQGAFAETERDDYDDAVKMYRCSRDYLIWVAER